MASGVQHETDQGNQIRLSEKEWQTWTEKARAAQLTTAEFVRSRLRGAGRPKPARKPVAPPEPTCEHNVPESQECYLCIAAEQAELDAQAADEARYAKIWEADEAARQRRQEAEALAKASGGAEHWFATMSSQDKERWGDLEQTLINAERIDRAEASWQRAIADSRTSWQRSLRQAGARRPLEGRRDRHWSRSGHSSTLTAA